MNSNETLKKIKKSAAGAGIAGASIATVSQPVLAQTAVDDAVTEITALPVTLGAIVGTFVSLGVAVMGVQYAFRIARRVRG